MLTESQAWQKIGRAHEREKPYATHGLCTFWKIDVEGHTNRAALAYLFAAETLNTEVS